MIDFSSRTSVGHWATQAGRYMRRSLRLGVMIAPAMLLAGAGTARADDNVHDCAPVSDKAFEFIEKSSGFVLRREGSKDQIPYTTKSRQRLSEVAGYCAAKSGRYRFKTEVYGITVVYKEHEKEHPVKFKCDHIQDETPAGVKCDREVKTIQFTAPASNFDEYQ